MKIVIYLLLLSIVIPATILFAKNRPPALRIGMTQEEVLTLAGPAISKKIMEVKKEAQWYYNGYSVLFKEGKVIQLDGILSPEVQNVVAPPTRLSPEGNGAKKTPPPDLMRNILKELPTTPGTPSAGPGSGPGVQMPIVPQPLEPMDPNP